MKKRYEALLALSTRGKEESVKEIIERLEKTFTAEGAEIEQIQRFEKRELAYELKHLSSAYFVNFIFEVEPHLIERLRAKLKLDQDVALQNYLQMPPKKKTAEAAA
ncbi:MAG TPA: 30S ribosomal protein S6 [Terrimicrobiaceae bacterium]